MISLWEYFLRRLGYAPARSGGLQIDHNLLNRLEQAAEQEHRPAGELANDLLSFALAQRAIDDERLVLWETLTSREQQITALTCLGYTNDQIASRLTISPETVKTHMRNVQRKFGLGRKTELRQALGHFDFSSFNI